MKDKVVQFYRTQIQPQVEALKIRAAQLKQRVTGWLAGHKQTITITATTMVALLVVVVGVYLWQRSPACRSAVEKLAAAAAGCLASLGVLFKGWPAEVQVSVVVTEQPQYTEEAAFPVEPGPDGHL